MISEHEREQIHKNHPVHLRQVVFPTRASEVLLSWCENAAESRALGLTVFAKPLMGLTTAIQIVAAGWPHLHPDIPCVSIRAIDISKFNTKEFWTSIAVQIMLARTHWNNQDALRAGIVRNLAARAIGCASDRLLLIIDAAHRFISEALTQISILQDQLRDEGVHLVVLLAGHDSLKNIRDQLYDESRSEPIRRYFENENYFPGMRNAQDLRYFFESFDKTAFPVGSDWSLSRFYFCDSFDRGWRLDHEAPRAWSVFARHAEMEGLLTEIEMPYVVKSVCTLFDSAFKYGAQALSPDEQTWTAAIKSCGVVESRLLVAQLTRRNKPKVRGGYDG